MHQRVELGLLCLVRQVVFTCVSQPRDIVSLSPQGGICNVFLSGSMLGSQRGHRDGGGQMPGTSLLVASPPAWDFTVLAGCAPGQGSATAPGTAGALGYAHENQTKRLVGVGKRVSLLLQGMD